MVLDYLSVGIDPDRSVIYLQSAVREVYELNLLLEMLAGVSRLSRLPSLKDMARSAKAKEMSFGLLGYPVLQAADILLYRADAVPVGEDQRQHLELTREIARKWNAAYGEYFPEPEAIIGDEGRILGLDGEAKMSKSVGNTVGILAEPDQVWARVRAAVTDPQRVRRDDPGRPEVCNVYTLHRYFSSPETVEDVAYQCRNALRGCVECKRLLADSIGATFAPMRERAAELRARPGRIREILDDGAERARAIARETMAVVRERMGMDWRSAAR
jgi:tryptophanyl-tRNA synthetase